MNATCSISGASGGTVTVRFALEEPIGGMSPAPLTCPTNTPFKVHERLPKMFNNHIWFILIFFQINGRKLETVLEDPEFPVERFLGFLVYFY